MRAVTGIAVFLSVGSIWAQNDSQLTPREAFWIKAPVAAKPAAPKTSPSVTRTKPAEPSQTSVPDQAGRERLPEPVAKNNTNASNDAAPVQAVAYAPLALRYSILQKKSDRFEEVDPDSEFHSGDRIRVKVEANSSAYLYIVMGGSTGQWRVLFPSKEIDGGNNRIEKGQPCTIPPEKDPAFFFDETAGVERVSLIMTRTPEPDLEKLIYDAGDPGRNGERRKLIIAQNTTVDGATVGQLRDQLLSRDLVFEKYDGTAPDGKQEKAVYAATRDKSQDARLFVDLKLIHK